MNRLIVELEKLVLVAVVACLCLFCAACGEVSNWRADVQAEEMAVRLESSDPEEVRETLGELWRLENRLVDFRDEMIDLLAHDDAEIRRLASYNLYRMGKDGAPARSLLEKMVTLEADVNARLQHEQTLAAIGGE